MTFLEFKNLVSKELDLRLDAYKLNRVERRIFSLMRRHQLEDLNDCYRRLQEDPSFKESFLKHFTINTSEFFRNPTSFKFLETVVLPGIFTRNNKVKIWSAACSNGSEPYSVAILINEMGIPPDRYEILATDIDHFVLEAAKKGIYNFQALLRVENKIEKKYFARVGEDQFKLDDRIKKQVQFEHQDLLKEKFSAGWNLIICRNFFIYLTKQGKDSLTKRFSWALAPGGILFLGNTEFIFEPSIFGLEKLNGSFYEKSS